MNFQRNYADTLRNGTEENSKQTDSTTNLTENKDTNTQKLENTVQDLINEKIEQISKWVLSILSLTLTIPEEARTLAKINSIIKAPTEEFLNKHFNIIQSVEGHIYIGNEDYLKKMKTNGKNRDSNQELNGNGN